MMENSNDRLRAAAAAALESNSGSPIAALDGFIADVIADGGLGGELIGWHGAKEEIKRLCLAYLRQVLQDATGQPYRGAPGIAPMKQRTAKVPEYKAPTASQLDAERRVRRLTRPAIFEKILDPGSDDEKS